MWSIKEKENRQLLIAKLQECVVTVLLLTSIPLATTTTAILPLLLLLGNPLSDLEQQTFSESGISSNMRTNSPV